MRNGTRTLAIKMIIGVYLSGFFGHGSQASSQDVWGTYMKLRTIVIASALLATPAYAGDLGVLTSLDVCDELGLTGLTISSETNCLQVSGTVYYEFYWGDYQNAIDLIGANPLAYGNYHVEIDDNGGGNDWYTYIETYLQF